jgi:phage tail-like protein
MPPGLREDPLTGYHFMLDIKQRGVMGAFRECSGLGSEQQVIEYKAADERGETRIYKLPGTLKWPDLSLKRGVISDLKLWQWRKDVEDGHVEKARTDGSIVLYDQANQEKARWNFVHGWPTKMTGPTLNATGNDIAIEEIVIAHEGLERVR